MSQRKSDNTVINRLILTSACAFGILLASYGNAYAEVRTGQYGNKVAYATGGIGQEERDELSQSTAKYTLHVTFASSQRKEYLSNVEATVYDSQDKVIFQDQGVGPFLYLDLPVGQYHAVFKSDGVEKKQSFNIRGNQQLKSIVSW